MVVVEPGAAITTPAAAVVPRPAVASTRFCSPYRPSKTQDGSTLTLLASARQGAPNCVGGRNTVQSPASPALVIEAQSNPWLCSS